MKRFKRSHDVIGTAPASNHYEHERIQRKATSPLLRVRHVDDSLGLVVRNTFLDVVVDDSAFRVRRVQSATAIVSWGAASGSESDHERDDRVKRSMTLPPHDFHWDDAYPHNVVPSTFSETSGSDSDFDVSRVQSEIACGAVVSSSVSIDSHDDHEYGASFQRTRTSPLPLARLGHEYGGLVVRNTFLEMDEFTLSDVRRVQSAPCVLFSFGKESFSQCAPTEARTTNAQPRISERGQPRRNGLGGANAGLRWSSFGELHTLCVQFSVYEWCKLQILPSLR